MKSKRSFHTSLWTGFLRVSFLGFLAILSSGNASAQSTGGRIRGTVSDSSGGIVVAAKVQLVNEATNVTREVETGSSGEYLFLEAPVGLYSVQIQQPGFKKFLRKGVEVHLNEVLNIDVVLQVGGAEQVVEVTGEPPVVDTTSTQLGA